MVFPSNSFSDGRLILNLIDLENFTPNLNIWVFAKCWWYKMRSILAVGVEDIDVLGWENYVHVLLLRFKIIWRRQVHYSVAVFVAGQDQRWRLGEQGSRVLLEFWILQKFLVHVGVDADVFMDCLPRNWLKVFIDHCFLWSIDYRSILGVLLLNQQCWLWFLLTELIHLLVQEVFPDFFNHVRLLYEPFGIEILTGTWSSQGTGKSWLFGVGTSKVVDFDYALLFWRWINLQIGIVDLAEI